MRIDWKRLHRWNLSKNSPTSGKMHDPSTCNISLPIDTKRNGFIQFLPLVLLAAFAVVTLVIANRVQTQQEEIRSRAAQACPDGICPGRRVAPGFGGRDVGGGQLAPKNPPAGRPIPLTTPIIQPPPPPAAPNVGAPGGGVNRSTPPPPTAPTTPTPKAGDQRCSNGISQVYDGFTWRNGGNGCAVATQQQQAAANVASALQQSTCTACRGNANFPTVVCNFICGSTPSPAAVPTAATTLSYLQPGQSCLGAPGGGAGSCLPPSICSPQGFCQRQGIFTDADKIGIITDCATRCKASNPGHSDSEYVLSICRHCYDERQFPPTPTQAPPAPKSALDKCFEELCPSNRDITCILACYGRQAAPFIPGVPAPKFSFDGTNCHPDVKGPLTRLQCDDLEQTAREQARFVQEAARLAQQAVTPTYYTYDSSGKSPQACTPLPAGQPGLTKSECEQRSTAGLARQAQAQCIYGGTCQSNCPGALQILGPSGLAISCGNGGVCCTSESVASTVKPELAVTPSPGARCGGDFPSCDGCQYGSTSRGRGGLTFCNNAPTTQGTTVTPTPPPAVTAVQSSGCSGLGYGLCNSLSQLSGGIGQAACVSLFCGQQAATQQLLVNASCSQNGGSCQASCDEPRTFSISGTCTNGGVCCSTNPQPATVTTTACTNQPANLHCSALGGAIQPDCSCQLSAVVKPSVNSCMQNCMIAYGGTGGRPESTSGLNTCFNKCGQRVAATTTAGGAITGGGFVGTGVPPTSQRSTAPAGSNLMNNGKGLTNGAVMNGGNFQVEAYCTAKGYGVKQDDINWICTNKDGSPAVTLAAPDFDTICQQTYSNPGAFAVQDGGGPTPAFNWRCYGNGPATQPSAVTVGGTTGGTSGGAQPTPQAVPSAAPTPPPAAPGLCNTNPIRYPVEGTGWCDGAGVRCRFQGGTVSQLPDPWCDTDAAVPANVCIGPDQKSVATIGCTASQRTTAPANSALLNNGIGLSTGAVMNGGNFQVEGYCTARNYGVNQDGTSWYCSNPNGSRAFTLAIKDYDTICQQTYNNLSAFAIQNGGSSTPAYNWRCYAFAQ